MLTFDRATRRARELTAVLLAQPYLLTWAGGSAPYYGASRAYTSSSPSSR